MDILLLNSTDITDSLSMLDAIEVMRHGFRKTTKEHSQSPARNHFYVEKKGINGQILIMPALLKSIAGMSLKLSSIFPRNKNKNLPLIHAIIILMDVNNGKIKAIIEGSTLTSIRTGAVSGLATDLLARHDSKSLAIIGSGKQAKSQLEAVCSVRNIENIFIYSRNKSNAITFSKTINLNEKIYINIKNIIVTNIVSEAIVDADIICTATSTSSRDPIIEAKDIKEGTHINAIGGVDESSCEIDPLLFNKSYIVVEQKEAAILEAGEIIFSLKSGFISKDKIVELGEILSKTRASRESREQITIFKSVGLAIEDLFVSEWLFDKALKNNIGRLINL